MNNDTPIDSQASFNQAVYQQSRINELLQRVDRLSTNPLSYNMFFGDYCYNVIFRDLVSVLTTISAKLKEEDKTNAFNKRNELDELLATNPPKKQVRNKGDIVTMTNFTVWKELNNKLVELRVLLEHLIDKYGFGNPTKDDPRYSASRR